MEDCLNVSLNDSSSRFNITGECARFDFIIYTLGMGTLCFSGLIGNIVSFTILWHDTSKGATTFLLRALAVADCLVLLAAIPLFVLSFVYPYTNTLQGYYDLYINILPYLWPIYQIPYTAVILLTVLVSLNRYMAVCKPFKSNSVCSKDQSKHHVIYIALFSILYNIPRFFEYEQITQCVAYNQSKEVFQISAFGDNKYYRIIYTNVLYFIIMLGGPLAMLSFLNVNLIRALKQRQQRRLEMGKSDYQHDITLVLVVVVFVFICCQTPTFVDLVLWTFVNEEERATCGHWHYYYTAIGDLFVVLNSSANFIIYVLTSQKFRHTLVMSCSRENNPWGLVVPTKAEMTVLTSPVAGNGVHDRP